MFRSSLGNAEPAPCKLLESVSAFDVENHYLDVENNLQQHAREKSSALELELE